MTGRVKTGLLSVGLEAYWKQFDGLYARLSGFHAAIADKIEGCGCEVVDAGMVDDESKSASAADLFREHDVEIIFLYIATYALSSTVLPVVRRLGIPVIVLAIQPEAAMDYAGINSMGDRGRMTGEWLAHCQACALPETASVFNRAGIRYEVVAGYMAQARAWEQIASWVAAARVARGIRDNRMGILGHYYRGMLDVYTDTALQSIALGTHIEFPEMCELDALRKGVEEAEIEAKLDEFRREMDVSPECAPAELRRAAVTSVAMDKLTAVHDLGSIAYYYEGTRGGDYEDAVTSMIAGNTLLTGRGVPVAGECEVKNVQAMKILSLLGAGGSFAEFYAIDFERDTVMLGHDGPAHFAIAEGRVGLVPLPLYHGKPGNGLSIQMKVRYGPVTVLSLCEGSDGLFLLVAEGESVPGPTLQIGNTNSNYRFRTGAREFVERWSKAGPSHHCAIGVGHVADTIEKYAFLANLPVIRIC